MQTERKEKLRRFYKLYIAPLLCKIKGHDWKKKYVVEQGPEYTKWRCHCTRCLETTFQLEANKRKLKTK